MEQSIESFHRDGESHWVAKLECGHSQHVRHDPPWHERPWVTTEAGRREHVGQKLDCLKCAMPTFPAGLTCYKRTPDFTAATIPKGLLKQHRTKAGTWAKIVIAEGVLLYVIETDPEQSFVLAPDFPGTVPPDTPHHIAPNGPVRFHVEFHR